MSVFYTFLKNFMLSVFFLTAFYDQKHPKRARIDFSVPPGLQFEHVFSVKTGTKPRRNLDTFLAFSATFPESSDGQQKRVYFLFVILRFSLKVKKVASHEMNTLSIKFSAVFPVFRQKRGCFPSKPAEKGSQGVLAHALRSLAPWPSRP